MDRDTYAGEGWDDSGIELISEENEKFLENLEYGILLYYVHSIVKMRLFLPCVSSQLIYSF